MVSSFNAYLAALNSRRLVVALSALCVLLILSGCSRKSHLDRVPIEGVVTLDGEPLKYGSIQFTGTKGPRVGGIIRDGAFSLAQEEGPMAGVLLVEIRAPRLPEGEKLPEEPQELVHLTIHSEELLPAEYNSSSSLKVTATKDGTNLFSFHLNSNPPEH